MFRIVCPGEKDKKGLVGSELDSGETSGFNGVR